MLKKYYFILLPLFFQTAAFGQAASCEQIISEIQLDSSKTIWSYPNLSDETFFCLGKEIARRDISHGIYIIQTYGLPEDMHPYIICNYEKHGFHFYYHEDIITSQITLFSEGYNEVSEAYLKKQIGDSAFMQLNAIPNNSSHPFELLSKQLNTKQQEKYLKAVPINDSTIHVYIHSDSLFLNYSSIGQKIKYRISSAPSSFNSEENFTSEQLQKDGFNLIKSQNGKYWFRITFDFSSVQNDPSFCWCNETASRTIQFNIPVQH